MDPVKSRGISFNYIIYHNMLFASICFVKNAGDKMVTKRLLRNPLKSMNNWPELNKNI